MNPFEWPVDWQALAVAITGVAAVVAAKIVTTNQDRTRRDANRLALFDRRLQTIEAIRKVEGDWMTEGRISQDGKRVFRKLVADVELLYDEETVQAARELFKDTLLHDAWERHFSMYVQHGQSEKAEKTAERLNDKFDTILEAFPKLRDLLISASRLGDIEV